MICLSPNHVNNGEDNDPNTVDEMPVERENFNAFRILGPKRLHERKNEASDEKNQADDHVKRMQADKRVVGCPKKICADRQAIDSDELVPLACGADEKDRAK